MADQLYVSYWLRGYNERNMLAAFGEMLRKFPFSSSPPGASTLRIHAIEYAEPVLLENCFEPPVRVEKVIEAASEFGSPDCAYLVSGYWDLWQNNDGWRLIPAPVQLACYGPAFQNELGDHLRVEVGLDTHFLPETNRQAGAGKVRSNIQGLLRLIHELDEALPVERRNLWTESGENFAERLRDSLTTVTRETLRG
ncbi:MAG: hypothetical protein EHM65_00440 [Acidobacteriales bacterium]|nr:MAG: hypothetical protein EHM65_00440 [Terriglobales bacterium]